ncbi:DNA polymerase beta superfamily protein [Nocardia sp. 004]|uniref:nucleotidyltransferase domain-containing protein n=1 Tax=Nocardia sp. 004 TaxID=3385978 RepID=UPI00399FA8C4
MAVRAIPASMDPTVVGSIDRALDQLEHEYRVSIRLAIESGSRAWGFPSPDSDYDCRFVYIAELETYLSPWHTYDVLEPPISGPLDLNGWDLAKALQLLVQGNAVLIEWLMSPITYRRDTEFCARLRAVAEEVTDRDEIARHYLHLGNKQWALFNHSRSLKKVFYSLRPAMVLRWLREHPASTMTPMHLPTLMRQCELPADLSAAVAELTGLKSQAHEMGSGPVPAPISAFITTELDCAARTFHESVAHDRVRAQAVAAEFFQAEALTR